MLVIIPADPYMSYSLTPSMPLDNPYSSPLDNSPITAVEEFRVWLI